jgi:hypothetical protein
VSKYDQNKKEVDFITTHFTDKKAIEPTYHVPLSTRAKNPVPCWRHKAGVLVLNGKIFPCCFGFGPEAIGIEPKTTWKEDILKVPMPCATCCFAEERFSPVGHNWYYEQNPSDSLKIEGVSGDLWVNETAEIKLPGSFYEKNKQLILEVGSLAPLGVFPITISLYGNGEYLDKMVLTNHGVVRKTVSLNPAANIKKAILTLHSDKSFRPSENDHNNHDDRMLSFRLLSVCYE